MATETIDHATLSRLIEAGAVRGAHVVGQSGGWAVQVKYGLVERFLAVRRGQEVRVFKKLETLVAYLKKIGIARFDVDAVNFAPEEQAPQRRPDRSEALKAAHAAAAHDRWFREQVQASIDDPRPSVPDEEVRATFAARKAALRQRAQ